METCYIYGLVDPRDGNIFYVGSSVNPSARLVAHMNQRWATKNVRNAICELVSVGLNPELRIIEKTTQENRRQREGYWIDRCRQEGNRLVNRKAVWSTSKPAVVGIGSVVYKWQKDAIEKKAKETGKPRTELIRDMLSFALENMP